MSTGGPEKRFTIRPNPPLSKDEPVFWSECTKQMVQLHDLIYATKPNEHVIRAVDTLLNRMAGTINTIWMLRRGADLDWSFDGLILLRCVYDAHIQARWILADPTKCEERALLYLDFQWIERKLILPDLDSSQTAIGKLVAKSPKRQTSEPHLDQQFARVRHKYLTQKGDKVRRDWSGLKIFQMVKDLGTDQEEEHKLLYKMLSGVVHFSALSLDDQLPIIHSQFHPLLAYKFQMRVLGRLAELNGVQLTKLLQWAVDSARVNIFNEPKPPPPKSSQA